MKTLLVATLSLSVLLTLPAIAAEVKVSNESSWDITEVYFAPSSQDNWGEDVLGSQILKSGMVLTLSDVSHGTWDVRLVDEDGDVCVVEDVRIKSSDVWRVTDEDLLGCQAETEEY